MAGHSTSNGGVPDRIQAHLMVIEARYYEAIGAALLDGATAEMDARGVTYEVISVPGALEIPQVLAQAAMADLIPKTLESGTYDGAIALGCVIRGETSHYDIVCQQSNHWLMEIAMNGAIPVGNAILTVENEAQAFARAEGGRKGKGADAVRACLALIHHARAFDEAAS